MNMKKKAFIPIILSVLMLAGCGSSKSDAAYFTAAETAPSAANKNAASFASESYYDYAASEEEYGYGEVSAESGVLAHGDEKENDTLSGDASGEVRKEMLVYSCNMTVDVLDFETAVNSFKNDLDIFGAFVENENYSDGGSSGRWYYADVEKWQTYNATVRVPSQNYEQFCDSAAALGDMRSKNASVQNLSREYYDLSATLEIYETKEARYMELLSTIQDEQYAIAVEEQLTSIQIEISKLKTRMNDIQTDVAYSYVYITLNEVKEYAAEPVKTDTFFQRLSNTVSDATSSFLNFMEGLLFVLIYLFPHLVIIALIVFIVIKIVKTCKKRKAAKASPAPVAAPAEAAPESSSEENKKTE